MPIIPAVPLVVHRHSCALHHPPHHHIQREERQPHCHVIHTPKRPNAHISMAKSTTIVLPCCFLWVQTAVYQHFGRLVYEPKRVTALSLPHLGVRLGQTLDTSWTLRHWTQTSKHPSFYPPFRRLDHDTSLAALQTSLARQIRLHTSNTPCNRKYTPYFAPKCRFSSLAQIPKSSPIPLSGLQCKKSDFLNTFSGLTPVIFEIEV